MTNDIEMKMRDVLISIFNGMLLRSHSSRGDAFAKFSLLLVLQIFECDKQNFGCRDSIMPIDIFDTSLADKLGLNEIQVQVQHWLSEESTLKAWNELKAKTIFSFSDLDIIGTVYESVLPTCLGYDSECRRISGDVANAMVAMVRLVEGGQICCLSCGDGQSVVSALSLNVPYESLSIAESSISALLIARIRMMLRGLAPTRIHATNAFENFGDFEEGHFDVVLATPHLGSWLKPMPIDILPIGNDISAGVISRCEYAYLLRGLALLKRGGVIAILLSARFLVESRLAGLRSFVSRVADVLAIVTVPNSVQTQSGRNTMRCLMLLKRKQSNESAAISETFFAKASGGAFLRMPVRRDVPNPFREITRRFLSHENTSDQISRWRQLPLSRSWTPNAIEADEWYRANLEPSREFNNRRDKRIREVLKLSIMRRDLDEQEDPRFADNTPLGIVEKKIPGRSRRLDFLIPTCRVLEKDVLLVSHKRGRLIANLATYESERMLLSDTDYTYSCVDQFADLYEAKVKMTFISLLVRSRKYAQYLQRRNIRDGWEDDFLDYMMPDIPFRKMEEYYRQSEAAAAEIRNILNERASCIMRVSSVYIKWLRERVKGVGSFAQQFSMVPLDHLWINQGKGASASSWNGPILRNINVDNNLVDKRYMEGLFITDLIANPIRDVLWGNVPWGYIRQFVGKTAIPVPPMDVQREIVFATNDDVQRICDIIKKLHDFA